MAKFIQEYFDNHCNYLSSEDILQMNKRDNGAINNVLIGLNKHCFGVWLIENQNDNEYLLFYINGSIELSGLICRFEIDNDERNQLTLAFSKLINDQYKEDTDLFKVFNTFQSYLRTMLEKIDRFTYGDELASIDGILMAVGKKGFDYVPSLIKKDVFTNIFTMNIQEVAALVGNKIYLMFNPRNGYTKIGRSIKPKARERTLQGEEPQTEIIALWHSPKSTEKKLHSTFKSKKIRGEWFNLEISDLLKLKKLMS